MGSSFRSDLRHGGMREWEQKLRDACANISDVQEQIHECIGTNGQFDDAADDGGLWEKLEMAKRFIQEELPALGKSSSQSEGV